VTQGPATTPGDTGRIITFYSYKGGCGRTMALANVAWILASNGYRVLTVDWDLESPGLHRYFHPFLLDKEIRETSGLIELLQDYADTKVSAETSGDDDSFADTARVDRAALSLRWNFPDGGVLDFLPPGRQDQHYSTKVGTFDWPSFWSELDGAAFIEALGTAMRSGYDYVLIDSRTGLSDSASVCTVRLPDAVVDCFAMSTQGVTGAVSVARTIIRERPEIQVYPLPGRVESGEQVKLQQGRDFAQRQFRPYVERLGVDVDGYWRDVEVPYKAYYAYEEILAVFGERPRQPSSPLDAFLALANLITNETLEYPVIADRQRRWALNAFERSDDAAPMRIIVQYAPVDRVWAEWIDQQLSAGGHDCQLVSARDRVPTLAGVDRVVPILSRSGLTYERVQDLWEREVERADVQATDFLVPIRINGPRLPAAAGVASSADLANLPEPEASDALARALGMRSGRTADATAGERIRHPATPAPHWLATIRRNPTFTGRSVAIEAIRDGFLEAAQDQGTVALLGTSGVGKTQIATEYMYRFAAAYDIVCWISADSFVQARTDFEQLADVLPVPAGLHEDSRVDAIKEALRNREPGSRWLLVFDNADDPATYAPLMPSGAGDILVTTRNQGWTAKAQVVNVEVFDRPESIALLARSGAGLSDTDAGRVAARLGDLPVAIETAGNWLAGAALSLEDYLEALEGRIGEMLSVDSAPGNKGFTATCELSMETLREQSPAAARLLELLCFMAPRPIPTAILNTEPIRKLLAENDPTLRGPLLIGKLVRNIGRSGLARSDPANRSIVIHLLIQQIIRESLAENVREDGMTTAHEALAAANPGDPEDSAKWSHYEDLRPHVEETKAFASTSEPVQELIVDLVRYLRLRSYYTSSLDLGERALAAWREADPNPDDALQLLLRFEIANTLWSNGDWRGALEIDEDILERLTRTLGEDHPYTLMAAGSYGRDLREKGDWTAAREREKKTYDLLQEVLGTDHPRTLIAASNYALSLRLDGHYPDASKLQLHVLNTRRRLLGREHRSTLASGHAYGVDLRNDGDLQGSRTTLEEALGLAREVVGAEHPLTLEIIRSLATTQRWLGEPQKANINLEEALVLYDKIVGGQHPNTIGARLERSCVMSDLGDDEMARRLATDADKAYRTIYDEHHPACLIARNNVAVFVRRTGDLAEGRSLAEENVRLLVQSLGPQHPATALAYSNVANGAYQAGEFDYASRTDDRAYRALKAALEPDHPALIAITVNTTLGRIAGGMPAEADLAATIAFAERALGPEHPITVGARDRKRLDLDIEPYIM
jgi:Mrp family chromosome partitioning ATPase/tetratricopeptide (TPR) repeat protein